MQALSNWMVGLGLFMLGAAGLAQGGEDPFVIMGVHRPASPALAPDLELPSLNGGFVHLSDLRGKVVLLGFFSTT